jgi:hypothetical protein
MAMIFTKEISISPKDDVNVFDLVYVGIEKDFPEQLSSLPDRKKRNLELSQERKKEHNQNHSKKRIVIEHTICRMEKYSRGYDQIYLGIN